MTTSNQENLSDRVPIEVGQRSVQESPQLLVADLIDLKVVKEIWLLLTVRADGIDTRSLPLTLLSVIVKNILV